MLRGVAIGAGYFSRFHYEAWSRIPDAELVALCDLDENKARATAEQFAIPRHYIDPTKMLDTESPDFVDIITPPPTHLSLVREAASRGVSIICQKPLAPTLAEAETIADMCDSANVRCMVHENFRFQPWHRQLRQLIDDGAIGDLHSLSCRTRTGDGWGADAYLDRQPYFRTMPRLLIYETGIHFIDTFRYLAGEVAGVFCKLRKLNEAIVGEDCGLLLFDFASGAVGHWDANRFNEPNYPNPRYTFGEFLLEGSEGSLRLAPDGTITLQELGQPERPIDYVHHDHGFGGDCVFTTQSHFIDRLTTGDPFETDVRTYLTNLRIQEAMYESASSGSRVPLTPQERP